MYLLYCCHYCFCKAWEFVIFIEIFQKLNKIFSIESFVLFPGVFFSWLHCMFYKKLNFTVLFDSNERRVIYKFFHKQNILICVFCNFFQLFIFDEKKNVAVNRLISNADDLILFIVNNSKKNLRQLNLNTRWKGKVNRHKNPKLIQNITFSN